MVITKKNLCKTPEIQEGKPALRITSNRSHLITYRIPRDLRKGGSDRLGLVFRDQDELPIADNLTRNIEVALDHSEFLIVVCSKDTPESLWVQREIAYFLKHHSRDRLLAILISGDPDQSFPKQLVEIRDADGNLVEEIEPLAANIVADSDRERNRQFLLPPGRSCFFPVCRQDGKPSHSGLSDRVPL